jgi:NADH dehydrogenase/NADH:ubiquinone oxidoreductase subunit G
VRIIINGIACEVEYGEYILSIARRNGIDIPTLCNSDALAGSGSCRLCVVELIERNRSKVVASCIYPITREVEIRTDTPKIIGIRKTIMKLLLSRAPENQYLNAVSEKYGLMPSKMPELPAKIDNCILCGLCAKACEELGSDAISTVGRGTGKKVSTPYEEPSVCPTGAIEMEEKQGIRKIWGKTFELLRCKRCGQYYAPKEYIDFVMKKTGGKLEGQYCSICRKGINAEKFRDIFGL